jgi:hypothetical protein
MDFTDEQLEVNNEWLEQRINRIVIENVVAGSMVSDSVGNTFCIAANTYAAEYGYDDYVAYAAYHYDNRIGELNTIISDVSYSDCVAAMARYREGERY